MKISVNNKETEITPKSFISDLALFLQLSDKGVALAVNNKMIPRTEWKMIELHENDQVIIIKAACGG